MLHNVDVAEHRDARRDPRRARAAGGEPGALDARRSQAFAAHGVTHVVECGPGKVLAGLAQAHRRRRSTAFALTDGDDARRGARRSCDGSDMAMAAGELDGTGRARHRRDARHRPRDRAGARARRRDGVGTATTDDGAATISAYLRGRRQRAATGIALDVTDAAATDAALAAIEARFGAIAILVNNAGITRDNLLLRMKDDEWDAIMATNLKPAFRLAKAVLRGMMKARHGRIIQIGIGRRRAAATPGQANYAAAKAALIGFTKSLAQEVGSRNITVNCVAPGFIDTDMTRALPEAQREALLGAHSARAGWARRRTSRDAVAFLAGPRRGLHHRRHAARQRRHVHGLTVGDRRTPRGRRAAPGRSGKIARFAIQQSPRGEETHGKR